MFPYWLLFSGASILALIYEPRDRRTGWTLLAFGAGLLITLFIGFRYRVGADWDSYEYIFLDISRAPFDEAMLISDPAFALINWTVSSLGGDVWWVNLICAALFTYGLLRFCSTFPLPMVGVASAIPSLIVVIAMGFTRQASAIACIMLAISAFDGRFNFRWVLWLMLGVAFHKSAIFMIPIFALATSRHRTFNIGVGVAIGLFLLGTFILGNLGSLLAIYVEGEMQSSGAPVRVAMALSTGVFYFAFMNRPELLGARFKLWRNMAWATLLLAPMFLLVESSTIVDRIAFLLLPFQIMVYSYIPAVWGKHRITRIPIILGIIVMNTMILGVWMLYADNASFWLPYRNVLTEQYIY